MIKRNGVSVQNDRIANVARANKIIEIFENKNYVNKHGVTIDLSHAIDQAVNSTKHYTNAVYPKSSSKPIVIEVTNETTTLAGFRLAEEYSKVTVLNFASAYHPGGGFMSGAKAQEEDLCRSSLLYGCLKPQKQFYADNVEEDNSYYTDGILYSPEVPFLYRGEEIEDVPKYISVLTCPAPNLSAMNDEVDLSDLDDKKFVQMILDNRALKIVKVARKHKAEALVLGAWGCGVFGNDPMMVAEAFKKALDKMDRFEKIVFAIYDTSADQTMFKLFDGYFAGQIFK